MSVGYNRSDVSELATIATLKCGCSDQSTGERRYVLANMERIILILFSIAALVAAGYALTDVGAEDSRAPLQLQTDDFALRELSRSRRRTSKSSSDSTTDTDTDTDTDSDTEESEDSDEEDEDDVSLLDILLTVVTLGIGGSDCADSAVGQALDAEPEDVAVFVLGGVVCLFTELSNFFSTLDVVLEG